MILSLRTCLAGLLACAFVVVVPLSCRSGGVGDPCTPEAEYAPDFFGFDLGQEYIESRSFQCATRICLVNHFQGRVSCPLGQAAATVKDCGGPGGAHDELCDAARGERCAPAAMLSVACDPTAPDVCASFGAACDASRQLCVCTAGTTPPPGYHCSAAAGGGVLPTSFVCHTPGDCQSTGGTAAENAGKACCVPGSDTPVAAPVCGQCSATSSRDAAEAVYCSCRCGVADGQPPEPDFVFCSCPDGFTCSEIRPDVALGDEQLTGKYCIKTGSTYPGTTASCGLIAGNAASPCNGVASASQ